MKKIICVAILFTTILAAAAAQTVYVGGSYKDNNWNDQACYWIDGKIHEINGKVIDTITVSDGKVYAAGEYSSLGKTTICGYWIDGRPYELPDCKSVNSISVVNGVVYVTGVDNDDETCYWVNGIRRPGPSDGKMRNLTVVNGVVYASGYYTVGTWPNETYYACYWIDGVRQELPNSANFAATTGIEAMNGKVYIGAVHLVSKGNFRACYWIDGVQHMIPDPEDLPADAFKVSNGNVYMFGSKHYYVNGIRQEFNIKYIVPYSHKYTVVRGKIYMTGGYPRPEQSGAMTSGYWVDGVHHALYGSDLDRITYATIKSIFVE